VSKNEQPIMMEGNWFEFSNFTILINGYIGCGGYINGDGVLSGPNWDGIKALEGDISSIDECFWFIESRYAGGTVLLKRNTISEHELKGASKQQLSNRTIVRMRFAECFISVPFSICFILLPYVITDL